MEDTTNRPLKIAGRLVVWVSMIGALIPLLFMVITSIKPSGDAQTIPPKWVFRPTLEHYAAVFGGETSSSQAFLPLLVHSAVVAVASTALSILVGVPAAYALARVRFVGRKFLSTWILSTIMFPPIVAAIPVFVLAGQLQLIDTYPILIIPYTAFNLPMVVWLLRSVIAQIPADIEEAARVDGCSRIGVIARMTLPLAVPGIVAAGVLSMILCWNEFLFALTLTRSDVKTAPVGVNEFTGMFGTQWGNLTAASTAIVAPILVMTFLLRRRLISGLTMGAVK
jgi:ABC-type glycerol-3-phosphate transport system permease component